METLKNNFIDDDPIMDSVYGVINISPFEKRLISTKEMQRLRGIKQLGFVNLVYPDAEHSRFAHSIGVSHQAKMIVDQVVKNITNSKKYQSWKNQDIKDRDPTFFIEKDVITPIERIVISAAALLHDLPHSPFSHEIETQNYDETGIPVHDDFANNPTLFRYLFNKDQSDVAKLIDIYNGSFWKEVQEDRKWGKRLEDKEIIDKDGYVKISENIDAILVGKKNIVPDDKLPVLGVMIFEILLFDKPDTWVKLEGKGKFIPNKQGVDVIVDLNKEKIKWKPIWKWFRPYRKDIIANTICADLLDYLLRDGRNTGILPSLDLKFFDRMTIIKAYPEKTETLIPLSELPDFCEHIVFDIFDHKRGIIRQSIITEIISFLQYRYLLSERVYNHRVVEGARSMLQEISRLLTLAESINVEKLHSFDQEGFSPINDEAFFAWVQNMEVNGKKEIIKAKKLVRMLQQRRIFREAVIIDGLQDSHEGTYRGNDVNCRTLADTLLNDKNRQTIIDKLNKASVEFCKKENLNYIDNPEEESLFTIGIREFGKAYKIPRVLVTRPLSSKQEDKIEVLPLFEAKKFDAINDRLESMQKSYDSLWKVYLFMHPFFHQKKYTKLHKAISDVFVHYLYEKTNITWKNSINDFNNLLPEKAIDIASFIKDKEEEILKEVTRPFILNLISIANRSINIDSFKLDVNTHADAIIQKILKLAKGRDILKNIDLQKKIIRRMGTFRPIVNIAARDQEELVINEMVAEIKKLTEIEEDFFLS